MITIKLPITNPINITNYQKQFTIIYNFAHNRFIEGKAQNEIEHLSKTLNNVQLMDASFHRSAVDLAKSHKEKIIFGGKKNWKDYNKGKISKEEYKANKLKPITVRGETSKFVKGNRKFELDIINNNQVLFKPKKGIKIEIKLPNTKHHNTLIKLQQLCELGETYFTCSLTNEYINITFDETILREDKHKFIENRILSMDLNPNCIALVICDYDKQSRKNIIKKEIIDLLDLNKVKNKDKIYHELFEINQRIITLCKHYQVESIGIEKLKIDSSDKGKGKRFNKSCNNDWRRVKLTNNLHKHCNILNINFIQIIPDYSSFVGQIENEKDFDSIGASLEIGRRANLFCRKYFKNENIEIKGCIIKVKEELPKHLVDRWKKILNVVSKKLVSYFDLYNLIKKMKYSYRFLFSDLEREKHFSFSLKSRNSFIDIYEL